MSRVMKVVPLVVFCVLIIAAPSVWANWVQDGVALCTATGGQYYPTIVSDGAGGAIVTWYDYRSGNADIYAQRVNSSGTVQWTANGVAISTATNSQDTPTIVSDGAGGAIITWRDYRSGTNRDIYAQKVESLGFLASPPRLVTVRDVRGDQGGKVTVAWDRSLLDRWPGLPITYYSVWRGINLAANKEQSGETSTPAVMHGFAGDGY